MPVNAYDNDFDRPAPEHFHPVINRYIGTQVCPWSCYAASLEYLSFCNLGNRSNPILQDNIPPEPWSTDNQGNFQTSMPWNPKSWNSLYKYFKLELQSVSEVQYYPPLLNSIVDYSNRPNTIFVLVSRNFRGNAGNKHAVAIQALDTVRCRIVSPMLNSNPSVKPMVFEETWSNISTWDTNLHTLHYEGT